jgi:hypothetical protein
MVLDLSSADVRRPEFQFSNSWCNASIRTPGITHDERVRMIGSFIDWYRNGAKRFENRSWREANPEYGDYLGHYGLTPTEAVMKYEVWKRVTFAAMPKRRKRRPTVVSRTIVRRPSRALDSSVPPAPDLPGNAHASTLEFDTIRPTGLGSSYPARPAATEVPLLSLAAGPPAAKDEKVIDKSAVAVKRKYYVETERVNLPAQKEAFRNLWLEVDNEFTKAIASRADKRCELQSLRKDLRDLFEAVECMHLDWHTWSKTDDHQVRVVCCRRFCASWLTARKTIGDCRFYIGPYCDEIIQKTEPFYDDLRIVHVSRPVVGNTAFLSYTEGLIEMAERHTRVGADVLFEWRRVNPVLDDGSDVLDSVTDEHLDWFEGTLQRNPEWDFRQRETGAAVRQPDQESDNSPIAPPESETIFYLGGNAFRLPSGKTTAVTDSERDVLQAFIGIPAHNTDSLKIKSGVARPIDALSKLRKRPEFEPLIKFPGGKNKDGYRVSVVQEK